MLFLSYEKYTTCARIRLPVPIFGQGIPFCYGVLANKAFLSKGWNSKSESNSLLSLG